MSTRDRRALLDRAHPVLSIRGQCRLLGLARSGVYRPPPSNDDADLVLMRRIDALFMAWPFLGSRRMTAMLRAEGRETLRPAGLYIEKSSEGCFTRPYTRSGGGGGRGGMQCRGLDGRAGAQF